MFLLFLFFQKEEFNIDFIQDKLKELYGDQANIVQSQVVSLIRNGYHGNLEKFLTDFFEPAVDLLEKLRQVGSCFRRTVWSCVWICFQVEVDKTS